MSELETFAIEAGAVRLRENWLMDGAARIVPIIHERTGHRVGNFRVGVGATQPRVGGLCYYPTMSEDGTYEIQVSIHVGREVPHRILGILAHELVHATGLMNHNRTFAAACRAIGLVGRPTEAGLDCDWSEVPEHFRAIVKALGPYPAARLNRAPPRKPQSTRMLKARCVSCGFTFRLSRLWADMMMDDGQCPVRQCGGRVRIEKRGGKRS